MNDERYDNANPPHRTRRPKHKLIEEPVICHA